MASLTQGFTDRELSEYPTWESTGRSRPKTPAGVRAVGEQATGLSKHEKHVNQYSDHQLSRLISTIEGEIIPRLMLAWRAPPERGAGLSATVTTSSKNVVEFTGLVLSGDFSAAMAYIDALRARGTCPELICLELLAPTARRLGDLWETDLCDFTQVTLGLCQLHRILRELDPGGYGVPDTRAEGRSALLVPTPGEQHTFGMLMVTEFFRRAGWDVRSDATASEEDLGDKVGNQWFAVVGLSLSSERHIDKLSRCIRTIRCTSCNRTIGVMVGGQLFNRHPELVARVGADATAVDGRQATMQAENLLSLLTVAD